MLKKGYVIAFKNILQVSNEGTSKICKRKVATTIISLFADLVHYLCVLYLLKQQIVFRGYHLLIGRST